MYNARELTFVAWSSVVFLSSFAGSVAWAQDGASEPAAATTPPPAADDASSQEEATSSNNTKWRPLVLRSEIPPDQRPIFGSFEGTYLMMGANVGLGLTSPGLLLGGEVSLVHQTTEFGWFGAYLDGVHDFGREQGRFSIGPEVGWSAFGLDAGYLLMTTPSGMASGITVRPLVSLGYVTLFGRFSKELPSTARVWSELGLLIKYPIEL